MKEHNEAIKNTVFERASDELIESADESALLPSLTKERSVGADVSTKPAKPEAETGYSSKTLFGVACLGLAVFSAIGFSTMVDAHRDSPLLMASLQLVGGIAFWTPVLSLRNEDLKDFGGGSYTIFTVGVFALILFVWFLLRLLPASISGIEVEIFATGFALLSMLTRQLSRFLSKKPTL